MKYYFVYTKELESIKCEKFLVKEMYLKKSTNYKVQVEFWYNFS